MEKPWTFNQKFDFIHCRALGGSVGDIPELLSKIYENLTPGGWLEWQEYESTIECDDGSAPPDCPVVEWAKNVTTAANKAGKRLDIALGLEKSIKEAGFTNVTDNVYKVLYWI
jgi:hypothetical protein